MFKSHRKGLIKHLVNLASFWKSEVFGQPVLPDMLIFIGQKFVENTKVQKFKMWHFGLFSNTVPVFGR